MKKYTKKMLALPLSVAMMAAISVPAFADQSSDTNGAVTSGTADTNVTAAITKRLETGLYTTFPAASFTFNFSQVTSGNAPKVNSTDDDAPLMTTAVSLASQSVTFSSSDGTDDETNGIKAGEKETADIFANVTGTTFPQAGVYAYEVTETADTYTIADSNKESMTYSQAVYTMYLYVANKSDNSGETYIKSVSVVETSSDDGATGSGSKVDPTPSSDRSDGSNSDMMFTNTYEKTPGREDTPDPTDIGNQMLSVSKTVTGDLGDKTKFFDFSITLTKSGIYDSEQTYTGYIMDANNAAVTGSDLPTGYSSNAVSFTTGTATTVKLKHDQKIVFTDVPIGTMFTTAETAASGYTPSAVVVENGTTITTKTNSTSTGADDVIVGENKSSVAVTNEYQDVTPTGILLRNLPAFILIILGAAAAVMVPVIRARIKKNRA